MGWFMYMEDNDARIISSEDNAVDDHGAFVGWIGVPRDLSGSTLGNTQTTPPVTDEDEIRYVKSPDCYH